MNPDLLNALVGVAVLVLPVVAGMLVQALRKLAAKWGLEATAQNTANMESNLAAALKSGIMAVLPAVSANGWNSPMARSAILIAATDYLQKHFPDRVAEITKQVGATSPESERAAVQNVLAGRLPDAIAIAAASPATPPLQRSNPP